MTPNPVSSEKIILDLNDLAQGKVQLATFKEKVDALDTSPYQNKHVQIKGCSPTWAHLLVAGKLFSVVSALDFLIEGTNGNQVVEIFRSAGPP